MDHDTSSSYRKESDSMGEISVPNWAYWGAQTQRSFENFTIGTEKMPKELILAICTIKKAAAFVNSELGLLSKPKQEAIVVAADEILDGKLSDQFPLVIWQTGSGTQTNMNVNEVISNRAIELMGGKRGSKSPIHPNDDVNKSQSSNDVIPSAIKIAAVCEIKNKLLPTLKTLHKALSAKAEQFSSEIKVGRTHLMDATPVTLGQEFSAYACQIQHAIESIEMTLQGLSELPIGGTAVGTGLNAPKDFGPKMAKMISKLTHIPFTSSPNKFETQSAHDAVLFTQGALKRLASALFKIANDIRWLASGPRAGLGEIFLPENEPGSSIMPGKVNPTQCEAVMMVAVEVLGYDAAISFANSLGNFELNTFQPLIAHNFLQSIRLLHDGVDSFTRNCIFGIRPNSKRLSTLLESSLMLATALNPLIGYDKATQVVKMAYHDNITLKEACLKLKVASAEEIDKALDPKKMVFFD